MLQSLTSTPSPPPSPIPPNLSSSPTRHAYCQDLLKQLVDEGKEGLEKHGDARKIDNRTCLWCLGHPDSYSDPASLNKDPVFMEPTKLLGISMMHMKVRLGEVEDA